MTTAKEILRKQSDNNNGWISVEERLPDAFKDVLLFHTYKEGAHPAAGINVGFFEHVKEKRFVVIDLNKEYCYVNATHWQPLPIPPSSPNKTKEL